MADGGGGGRGWGCWLPLVLWDEVPALGAVDEVVWGS